MSNEGVVATIRNGHVESCGEPPGMDSKDAQYLSVFENEHGEQWVFAVVDGKATLRGGDIEWGNVLEITDETVREGPRGSFVIGKTILDTPEALFVQACLMATGFRGKKS